MNEERVGPKGSNRCQMLGKVKWGCSSSFQEGDGGLSWHGRDRESPGRGHSLSGYRPGVMQLRASSDKVLGEHLVWLQDALMVQVKKLSPKRGLRALPEH